MNLKCFWICCITFMSPVPMGTVCVVFGATQAAAGWGTLSDQGVDFVAGLGCKCGCCMRNITSNA